MPFFQYVGDKSGEGHEVLEAFGYTFNLRGDPVEVKDPSLADTFRTNSHFKEVEGGAAASQAASAPAEAPPAAEAEPAAPTPPSGDKPPPGAA